ncbi:type II secretion system protein [Candidatus Nomurabacteria bacterium]|nr:type II secretion system protein [Candidatus Nomurabacteria bacterium]MCB9827200.1 type II secretion system protein [Candidatus Nomurabacteria bacterium]MCB9827516.1 type II secretion system protein [Candidatus Nomurabacteria bacterium]
MKRYTAQSGFTLIEMMMVIAIMAILSGFLLPGLGKYLDSQSLFQAQDQVKGDLRSIQTRALTGAGFNGTYKYWGVMFVNDQNKYEYFLSASNNDTTCTNADFDTQGTSQRLPGNMKIVKTDSGAASNCYYFAFDSGNANFASGAGNIYIGNGTSCVKITINSAGFITADRSIVACN